jgi:hypothetical protein
MPQSKLTPLCRFWLQRIAGRTTEHGGMLASSYMNTTRPDIRAVERLIYLGLVERVTPEGGGEISVRAVSRTEAA